MTLTRAAPSHFPYAHRTIAEIDESIKLSLEELDWISRRRPLTESESRRLQRMLEKAKS